MAERGAEPEVHPVRRRALRAVRHLFSPLLPDDYLELINPLWTTKELRGRVEKIEWQGSQAVTVSIMPGFNWPGHKPGQYIRLGVLINGRFHWRAYSLTSDPEPEDGLISLSPKVVESGTVSPYLVHRITPGTIVRLGEIEGVFTLPDPLPEKMLFISAGSGITPIISMLRSLDHRQEVNDVVIVHSAHKADEVMFGDVLKDLDDRYPGFRLHLRITEHDSLFTVDQLDDVCPDWREREAFCSGPGEMTDSFLDHFEENGLSDHIHYERFQPVIGGQGKGGAGGKVHLTHSKVTAECDGDTPILEVGEEAGVKMPYGCRIGVCHTCVGTLLSGQIRDLRSGEVGGSKGDTIRTCVNTAEGDIAIGL
ncbi:ferredoxin reductase [Hoyosella subflava]|nr:ferredoxin reductase [Hoyosella subflava]